MIEKVMNYCLNMLKSSRCSKFAFHNAIHTLEVVANVTLLGNKQSISDDELEPILIAAWFHDIGMIEVYEGHEEVSKRWAKEFLTKEMYNAEKIKIVLDCIESTRLPHIPKTSCQEIICDADILHISNPNFFYRNLLLRIEWEAVLNKFFDDREWLLMNLGFLNSSKFFTPYGKQELERGKVENIIKVEELLKYSENPSL